MLTDDDMSFLDRLAAGSPRVFTRMLLHEGHPDAVAVVDYCTGETEWLESDDALRRRIKASLASE